MPWINKTLCTGCQLCVNECCVGAISMETDIAVIHEDECIRCGVCHEICPVGAVRHDGERIPDDVKAQVDWAKTLLTHPYYAHDPRKQRQLLDRLQRYFAKNKIVAEKTREQLQMLRNTEYAEETTPETRV